MSGVHSAKRSAMQSQDARACRVISVHAFEHLCLSLLRMTERRCGKATLVEVDAASC